MNKKIKETGKITPDMIDNKISQLLLKVAKSATEKSYAPYSNFHVGAAVISENGKIYKGCNVENASYGVALCAERNALSNMVADSGYQQIAALGVFVNEADGECYPCGACRQWIEEFDMKEQAKIIVPDKNGEPVSTTIKELLPNAFGPKDLDTANKIN